MSQDGANQDRLVELIIRATDDRASEAELAELDALRATDALAARVAACHLAIDDILSQQLSPARSAEAFLDGFRERVRIAADGDVFRERVMAAIVRQRPWGARVGDWGLRVGGLAAAAVLAIGLLGFLLAGFHPGRPQSTHGVDGVTALQQQSNPDLHLVYDDILGRAQ